MLSRIVRACPWVGVLPVVLVLGACAPAPSPSPSSAEQPRTAAPSPTEATTVSGEFDIKNTTPGGDPVRIETMAVHLETSPAGEATWNRHQAKCETDPEVPVSFDDRLIVRYACDPGAAGIPGDVRLRAVVEATIAGSDELFRLESELAR